MKAGRRHLRCACLGQRLYPGTAGPDRARQQPGADHHQITGLPSQGTLRFSGNPIAVGSTLSVADIAQLGYQHSGSQVTSAGTDSL